AAGAGPARDGSRRGQNLLHPPQARNRRLRIVNERDADVALAWIDAGLVGATHISAGQHADAGFGPQPPGRRLAIADVEPQKESPGRPHESELLAEDFRGRLEICAVSLASLLDVSLVAPQGGRGGQDWVGHGDAAIVDELGVSLDQPGIAGDETRSQAGY